MTLENKVIVCVGPPGNGRDHILMEMRKTTSYHYYHLFEYLVKEAYLNNTILTKINILDFYESSPERMEQYRRAAIKKIIEDISKQSGIHVVSTSLQFEWKGDLFLGLNEEEIKCLCPDMFVIIYDDIFRVKKRLIEDVQWKNHSFTLGEIANWRREEINLTYKFANMFKPNIEVQLVAYENGPNFLKNLIWSYGREKAYLSHPITGEGEDFLNAIFEFGKSLSEYYIIFDPTINKDWNIVEAWRETVNKSIEKGVTKPKKFRFSIRYGKKPIFDEEIEAHEIESAIKNLRFQVIDTDYKLIDNCAIVIVYHPRASISAGVMCEMIYAKAQGKLIYTYYPYEPNIFFEWYSTRMFRNENEFKAFLIKESKHTGQRPLDIF